MGPHLGVRESHVGDVGVDLIDLKERGIDREGPGEGATGDEGIGKERRGGAGGSIIHSPGGRRERVGGRGWWGTVSGGGGGGADKVGGNISGVCAEEGRGEVVWVGRGMHQACRGRSGGKVGGWARFSSNLTTYPAEDTNGRGRKIF